MSGITFDVDDFLRNLDFSDVKVRKGAERGMNDAVDDLVRVSSEIAPHDKGTLSRSHDRDVSWTGNKVTGEVTYSVTEASPSGKRFNYALWTHEQTYNLGDGSRAKPGTSGMSGKHYDVGNKYVERPLKGESDAYKAHIAKEIRKELDG